MKIKKILSTALAATLLMTSMGITSMAKEETKTLFTAKFDFGTGGVADDYNQVTKNTTYTEKRGYGVTDNSSLKDSSTVKDDILKDDYVTSTNAELGINFTVDVPDGDYSVNVITGGDTETNTNIYINGGERVRVYKIDANSYKDNVQPVIPKNGQITIQVKGENAKVNAIEVTQLAAREEKGEKSTIYIAGDSTAQTYGIAANYPQTGWGQVAKDYFSEDIIIENRSMGGRSLKSYNNDGRLDSILTQIKPNDYVFIQFGHNDGSSKPERYISIDDFKVLLKDKYIGETVKRGAIPVILTPTPHYSPDENGAFAPTIIDYANAAKEVATENNAYFIDIQQMIADRWNELGSDKVKKFYFINEQGESVKYPEGTDDHTHFKEAGAREVAKLVAEGASSIISDLKSYAYTKNSPKVFSDLKDHWSKDMVLEMVQASVINGVSATAFEPERDVTRAEFLSMVMRACAINGKAYRQEDSYSDIKLEDWFCYDIQGAKDKGIIPEFMVESNKFNPNTPITREEMTAIAVKSLEFTKVNIAQTKNLPSFDDMDKVRTDASEYIVKAVNMQLVKGVEIDEKVMIYPNDNLTRAEAATVSSRVYDIVNK